MPSVSASRVAIIGAGVSGVVTAAHLKRSGLDVTVFERLSAAGGVWIYSEQPPLEPEYPAVKASIASDPPKSRRDSHAQSQNDWQFRDIARAPPGPCYRDLKNNVSTTMLKTTLVDFPPGTPEYTNHHVMASYIREIARVTEIEEFVRYQTLVENVSKKDEKWELSILDLKATSENGEKRELMRFDAVVVATGHYHAPRTPDIPGLRDWKSHWPTKVQHSKSYRVPEVFKDKNVLLIGAGTSSTDIAKEIGPFAKTIWQSSRGGFFDFSPLMLPPNAYRIGEIASFDVPSPDSEIFSGSETSSQPETETSSHADEPSGAIPSTVTLKSGQKICDIDHVIVCTGYHVSLPFLRSYHRDDIAPEEADETVLVTDGTQYHNLHKDIFYIPDPSLAFVGVPYFGATFTLFEFQAMVVAAVLSGDASLPGIDEMRKEYVERIKSKGCGKRFHSVRFREVKYVDELLAWINREAAARNKGPRRGHTDEWKVAKKEVMERMQLLMESDAPGVTTAGWIGSC